jgi:hypothetical protein
MTDKPVNRSLAASNLTAQIHHRGAGNPASISPRSAISNCFPGLEFDFRNLWRRAFEGIVLIENNNYVVSIDDPNDLKCADLISRRLLRFGDEHGMFDTNVLTQGPTFPDNGSANNTNGTLVTQSNPNAVSFMEWSNSMARILHLQGKLVQCEFSARGADTEILASDGANNPANEIISLRMRHFFSAGTAEFAPDMLQPGDLTQGLCAPWQNDYRECACYYWAASRPDYVNVEPGTDGLSHGDMWFAKKRTGTYIPDDRTDKRLWSYDDLFIGWQQHLRFIIKGRDADES